jgi:hypothetical protein
MRAGAFFNAYGRPFSVRVCMRFKIFVNSNIARRVVLFTRDYPGSGYQSGFPIFPIISQSRKGIKCGDVGANELAFRCLPVLVSAGAELGCRVQKPCRKRQ